MKNLLTLFVLFFSSSVFGEWITYAEDNGISYHYEDKTIRQTKNFVYVWNLISYEEEQKVQQISFHSMVSYFKIDCKINAKIDI